MVNNKASRQFVRCVYNRELQSLFALYEKQ